MAQYFGMFNSRRLTTAEATVVNGVGTGPAKIGGVLFCGTGTGIVSLFSAASTATCTASQLICGPIRAYTTVAAVTVNQALWIPVPAAVTGVLWALPGTSGDVDLTLFWAPQ